MRIDWRHTTLRRAVTVEWMQSSRHGWKGNWHEPSSRLLRIGNLSYGTRTATAQMKVNRNSIDFFFCVCWFVFKSAGNERNPFEMKLLKHFLKLFVVWFGKWLHAFCITLCSVAQVNELRITCIEKKTKQNKRKEYYVNALGMYKLIYISGHLNDMAATEVLAPNIQRKRSNANENQTLKCKTVFFQFELFLFRSFAFFLSLFFHKFWHSLALCFCSKFSLATTLILLQALKVSIKHYHLEKKENTSKSSIECIW